jgi:hypothetical protein
MTWKQNWPRYLTHLCYHNFQDAKMPNVKMLEERSTDFKLYWYAVEAWALHASPSEQQARRPAEVVNLTMRLFYSGDGNKANFKSWLRCYQHFGSNEHSRRRITEPIFVAASFGLTDAATILLDEALTSYKELRDYLIIAATNGHTSMARATLSSSATNQHCIAEYTELIEQTNTYTEEEANPGGYVEVKSRQLEEFQKDFPKALRGRCQRTC